MFDKEYTFYGKHADMVKKLTAQFDNSTNIKLFSRNVDVYILAPVIGFMHGKTADIDTSGDQTTKIFADVIIKEASTLKYIYQIIMLLHDKQMSLDDKLDKAFRNLGNKDNISDEKLFNSYVLGGVEYLFDKLIIGANSGNDYLTKLYDFLDEFDDRFNKSISTDAVLDLCTIAKQ